ncbi:MAG: serine/threonine protein kinase [Sedimentitalea sp.]
MGQTQAIEDAFDEVTGEELEPGHTLMQGQYTIEAFLNAGGFGITYLARNSLDRKVVIKECFPGSFCRRSATSVYARSRSHTNEFSAIVRKFVDEAHSLAKVKHPNIVGVHQVFEENKTAYMALDFVEGRDLLDMIEGQETLPDPEQIETILRKLLDAIGSIHNQGMLHRDISPDNILLQSDMEPILIDFGAARQEAGLENRVLSEMRVVKDGYSPQEFYVSGADQGPFSDLYALAATFYHVITGELPVNAQTRLAAVAAGDADPYVPVSGRMPAYSDAFLRGIDTALEILPKDRLASADLWLNLLNGTDRAGDAAAPAKSKAPKTIAPAVKTGSKTKARLLGVVGLAIPIIGAVYVLQNNGDEPSSQATTAALADAGPTFSVAGTNPIPVPTPSAVPNPPKDTAAALDLSAILNLPTAPAQPETSSPEALTPADLIEAALLGNAQKTVDIAPTATEPAVTVPKTTEPAVAVPTLDAEVANPVDPALADAADLVLERPVTLDELALAAISVPQDTAVPDTAQSLLALLAPEPQLETPVATPKVIIESFDLPQITSAWSVDLTGVLPVATDTIYAINNVPLEQGVQIDTVLHQMLKAPEGGTMELSVLAGASENDATVETVTAPVIHKTVFGDGIVFETRISDGTWKTIVANVPAGSDFQISDIVVGDMGTETPFDKRTSLPETLVQANAQNLDRLTFAVRRDGITTPISMSISR